MTEINELKVSLKKKWCVLGKARELDASPKQLIAIRNKIYEDQDKLVELFVKHKIDNTKPIFGPFTEI